MCNNMHQMSEEKPKMMVREVSTVVYGASSSFSKGLRSMNDLRRSVEKGLPKEALRDAVEQAVEPHEVQALMYRLVPRGTLSRRKRLSAEESAKVERLARVVATAQYVLEDDVAAKRFMSAPHRLLDGARPADIIDTEIGARQIEDLLWQAHYGVVA